MGNLSDIPEHKLWSTIKDRTSGINADSFTGYASAYEDRLEFTQNLAWAIPSKEAITEIVKEVSDEVILEFGSGLGLWAKLLQLNGAKVRPYDIPSPSKNYYDTKKGRYTDITIMEHAELLELAELNKNGVMMLCWPCYDKIWAYELVKAMEPSKIIYIGESSGGCTGDKNFHRYVYGNYDTIEGCVSIPNWDGIHDRVYLYRKLEVPLTLEECPSCRGSGEEFEEIDSKCWDCDGFGSYYSRTCD